MRVEWIVNEHLPGLNPVQFGSERCAPSHAFGPAVRTHWLLHYVISGQGRFTREGETHPVHAGNIFVIPPYLETYYQADVQNPWHYVWIGFTADARLPEALRRPVLHYREAGAIFEEMRLCAQRDSGRSAYLAGCLWKLMSLLQEEHPGADYLEKALNLMQSEYMNGITIQEIADRLGLNRSYFSELFRSRMGVAPGQYLLRLRLEKACELLLTTNGKNADIAQQVGFSDPKYFNRLFVRQYGMPAHAYRKSARKGEER